MPELYQSKLSFVFQICSHQKTFSRKELIFRQVTTIETEVRLNITALSENIYNS